MNLRIQISVLGLLLASNVMAKGNEAIAVSELALPQDFSTQPASIEVKQMAQWVIESGDNTKLPFILVDKINAKIYAFNAAGQFQGATPVLLGLGRGDRSVAGIGRRTFSQIPPKDRITPAGRFVSSLSLGQHMEEILVIDYADALSMHPVIKGTPKERRSERLQSITSTDNRISYGCINVPVLFFSTIISPAFKHSNGIVYILPEMSPAMKWFATGKLAGK
ncbi:MAG: L,D-transpeptidase [Arenimonas sp.]